MSVPLLRLVCFDVTNTLIRIKGSPGIQYSRVAKKFGIDVDDRLLTPVWFEKYKRFSLDYPNFGSAVNMPATTWWARLVRECFLAVDPGLNEDVLDKVADSLYFHFGTKEAWDILPGAAEAVRELRGYKVKTAIVSNWDHRLYKLLISLGLRDCFDFVLPSYILGVEKPNPAIFLQALQDANCVPDKAVHLGDHVEKDFMGARNAGMDAYLIDSNGNEADGTMQEFVVPNVQSFIDIIRPRLEPALLTGCKL